LQIDNEFVVFRKICLFAGLLLCMASAFAQFRHVSLQNHTRELPKKVLLLPADVLVRELSAGGLLEKVPEWTRASAANLNRAMAEVGAGNAKFAIVELPPLAADEQEKVEQALATFMVVGVTAYHMLTMGGEAWEHKRREFDYTLGPALAFLKQKTGADAALLVAADDIVSTDGRKAAVVLAALLRVGLQTGRSIAVSSLIDLESGDLLWMHYDQSLTKDLKDYAAARDMVADILSKYPGGK
jgi:hypothetical protein